MKRIALALAALFCFLFLMPTASASWAELSEEEVLESNVKYADSIVVASVSSAEVYSFLMDGEWVSLNLSTDGDLQEMVLSVESQISGGKTPASMTLWFCSGLSAGDTAVFGLQKNSRAARETMLKKDGYDPGEYTVTFQYEVVDGGQVLTPNGPIFASVKDYASKIKNISNEEEVVIFEEQAYATQLYNDSKIYASTNTKSKVLLAGEAGDLLAIFGKPVTKNNVQWTKVLLEDYSTGYVQTKNLSKYRYTISKGTQFAQISERTPIYSDKGVLTGYAREGTLLPVNAKIVYGADSFYFVGMPNFDAHITGNAVSFHNGNKESSVPEKPDEILPDEFVDEIEDNDPTIQGKLFTSDYYYTIKMKSVENAKKEAQNIIQTKGYPRTITVDAASQVSFNKKGPVMFFRSGSQIIYYNGYNILSQKEMVKKFGKPFYTRHSPESIAADKLELVSKSTYGGTKAPYQITYWLSNNERYTEYVFKTESDATKARKEMMTARNGGSYFEIMFSNGEGIDMSIGQDAAIYQKGKLLICYEDDMIPKGSTYAEVRKQTNLYLTKLYGKQY